MQTIDLFTYGILNGQFPRHLYKYRTYDQARQIISNPALFFPSYENLNDPFECFAEIECSASKAEWYQYILLQGIPQEDAVYWSEMISKDKSRQQEVISEAIEAIKKQIGILSLSINPLETLLWSHYAQGHMGVCIEFDLLKDIETFNFPIEVIYDNDVIKFNYIRTQIRESGVTNTTPLYHKTKDWEYEAEYRVLKLGQANKLVKINPHAISSVIFGAKTIPQQIRELSHLIKDKGFDWVQLKKIKIDRSSNSLSLEEIK